MKGKINEFQEKLLQVKKMIDFIAKTKVFRFLTCFQDCVFRSMKLHFPV